MIKQFGKIDFKNKFLLIVSFLFYLYNILSFFTLKIDLQFEEYTYKISSFDILFKNGLMCDTGTLAFPFWIKLLACVSIFGGIFSYLFLIKGRMHECLTLAMFFSLSYICFPLLGLFTTSINSDFRSILMGLFISVSTIFVFLSYFRLEYTFKFVLKVSTFLCVFILFLISAYMIYSGLPAVFKVGVVKFLFGTNWAPMKNDFGILPFICCSLAVTIGSIVVGVPIGVLTSVFLSEFANPVFAKVMNSLIKLLAGIPSVVFGFFGMLVVVPFVKKMFNGQTTGDCLLTSIIILSMMILPTIISISESAVRSASKKYLEPSLALGESKARSIFKVVIPAAKDGIISGTFLGLGRALGETMAVIMVSGNSVNMPNLLKSSRFLTTAMALEFAYASGLHRQVLFSIGLVLFIIIVITNLIFIKLLKEKKN